MQNKTIILGVSGDAGSFSEEAGLEFAKKNNMNVQLVHLMDMEGVLAAIDAKKIDLGIFPVVNFRGGIVKPAFEAMGKYSFIPIDDVWLNVQQCILVRPDTKLSAINKIVSHPQGLAQCKNFLKNNYEYAELVEWIDTAKAAKDLAENVLDEFTAVIAPEQAARMYHLNVHARNIQDENPNFTVFIVVKPFAFALEENKV